MIIKENLNINLNNTEQVAEFLNTILNKESEIDQNKEHFWVIGLNVKNRVQYADLTSLGTLTMSVVHPREVFRLAISKGVCNIVIAHNHPSGDPEPSFEDRTLTKKLRDAGEIIGIHLLDHVIIGNGGSNYVSLKERGEL